MKSMTIQEAKDWCLSVGPRPTKDNLLRYTGSTEHRFFVLAPEEFRRIMAFTRMILTLRGETAFCGGLIWLRRWNIGTPQFTKVGWQIIENVRRAHGDLRSLDVAPAELFREDELVDLHGFLVQVIGFGWVAEFVPSTGGFFVHFKDNRQVCVACESMDSLNELRLAFSQWNPTDDDPMALKLAQMEKEGSRRG